MEIHVVNKLKKGQLRQNMWLDFRSNMDDVSHHALFSLKQLQTWSHLWQSLLLWLPMKPENDIHDVLSSHDSNCLKKLVQLGEGGDICHVLLDSSDFKS